MAFQRNRDREENFAKLYTEFSRNVFAYCRARSRGKLSKEDCQDIVNDVFLQAWLNLYQLRKRDSFKSWLLAICHRETDRRLKAKRVEETMDQPLDGTEDPPVVVDFD